MDISVRKVDLMKLDGRDIAGINRVLANSRAASFFHTLEWNRLLVDYFRLPYAALLACDRETAVGLHILYQFGDHNYRSPAIDLQSVYGGPVAAHDDPAVIQALLRASERTCPFAYFQIWTSPGMDTRPFTNLGYSAEPMFTPIMDLTGSEEERWSRLDKDKRYKIRRALSLGLVVEEAGMDSVCIYHQLVAETLSRSGLSPLPGDFMERLMTEFQPAGLARLFFVRHNGERISGTVILYYKNTAYGWDIGWRREFAKLSPNDVLTWEISNRASRAGFRHFDLLRIEPDRLPGIAKWKETFNGEIVPCCLLRKTTMTYRFLHPINILFTRPERVAGKLMSILRK